MIETRQITTQLDVSDQEAIRASLLDRRARLRAAPTTQSASLAGLLVAVDSALDRLEGGSFGACTRCDGHVDPHRLLADPLATVCLECLTDEERGALQRDLELASRVQATLLPPATFHSPRWSGHYVYRPHGTVGGDYVDVLRPNGPDGDLIVFLGDVSGKGVAAAMLMSHLHAGMRALATSGCSLSELIGRANQLLHGASIANLYATLAAVRLTPEGVAEVVTAGHPPVLVVGPRGVVPIATAGLPVGLFAAVEYTSTEVALEPGEALVMYTDGVTESLDPGGDELGVDRLSEALTRACEHSPEHLVDSVVAIAEQHRRGSGAHDDTTVMAVCHLPRS